MRPTKHRRRFHTDRIVRKRRARYLRESQWLFRTPLASNHGEWLARRLSYGYLADRDPWDCGRSCFMCHYEKRTPGRREREERQWRKDWGLTSG